MTGLASDLTAIVDRHTGQPADALAQVPIGVLRATLIHVNRFDASPLFDRMKHIALCGHVQLPEIE